MNHIGKKLILGAVLALSAATLGSTPVRADDYWDGHWRWYDNSYRPYYHRHYYRNGYYGGGYRGYGAPYGNYQYYGPSPYYGNGYYYGPNVYYPGNSVQVGPLRFGWW